MRKTWMLGFCTFNVDREKSEQETAMTDHTTSPSESVRLRNVMPRIVTAYVGRNTIPADTLPELVSSVFHVVSRLGQDVAEASALIPAVLVKKSVFADYIICLEDGGKLKTLKRHLQAAYGLTPQQYREKWSLPENYPMVAPSYARRRSAPAHELGLGRVIKATPEPS